MKIVITLFAALLLSFNTAAYALDGTGKIVEVRSCVVNVSWKSRVQFKLSDGNWFAVNAVHHGSPNIYSDTVSPALVMMAFSADYTVNVRATANVSTCGGITTNDVYTTANDYIHVIK